MKSLAVSFACCLAVCGLGRMSAFAAESEKSSPRVIVLELEAKGVKPELVQQMTDALLLATQQVPGFQVMGRDEIRIILEHEGQRQALACSDDSCLADLGQMLKGDYVLSGSVGKVGEVFLINARLFDVKRVVVHARATATALNAEELLAAAGRVAQDLLAPQAGRGAGQKSAYSLVLGEDETKIAVLNLSSSGSTEHVAENLTQVIVVELKQIKGLSLITRDEIKSILSFEQDRQLLGCDDSSCLAELGGALGVEYLLTGNVGQMGATYLLHLKLINIREATVANRVAESFTGDESQLLNAAKFTARRLLGRLPEGEGGLEVRPSVASARLLVDGQEALVSAEQQIKAGKVNLRLEADGFQPWIGDAYVDTGRLTRLDVELVELPTAWYQEWWLWTSVGTVIATGAALGFYYGFSQGPNTASLDIQAGLPGGGL